MASDDTVKKDDLTLIQCFPANRCKPDEHEWPSRDVQDDSRCVKCGMSFLAHIHMEMP